MTASPAFIAGDWGTSNLRLALCDRDGNALEVRRGPGAADTRGKFAQVFDAQIADWRGAHGDLPAILSGMVGSTIGWIEVPYLPCPAELYELAENPARVRDGVFIVPGMRCSNPLGAPDVMRGEETQLLGARHLDESLEEGKQLVCMPGTHTKWVSLHKGAVQEFLTAPTGELFAMLCEHSVLVRDQATPIVHQPADFERGLAESVRHPEVNLLHRLFQSRSLRIDKQLTAEGAASWMSGLLIGSDVAGALSLFPDLTRASPVYAIGTPQLTESYARALARHGRKTVCIEGDQAALAGLTYVFLELERQKS
ncbi:MAG: 2-dehydro-3-deoxygalactonokinase [Pseudomonadota bacterium]